MNNITGVILTKNEEGYIEKCIKTLSFCDEVIVIDDYSADDTVKISRKAGAKVFKRALAGNFASQRNFGLKKAKGKWVLFVDADESITQKLAEEIISAVKNEKVEGYYLKRRDIFMQRALFYGESGDTKLLRLAIKDSGKWKRKVHEYWDVKGSIGELKNQIIHNSHIDLQGFVKKLNYYSALHARANLKEDKRSSMAKIIIFPSMKFFLNYVLKLGFLDGLHGFVFAVFMSLHSFLSWSKLWLLQQRKT